MPRLPRIHLDGAIYYVTSRASQNEEIFKDKEDYKMYLELVNKYKSQHKFKLYSYCLLPDHLELLIETGDDASISEVMHDLNSLYTKYFNGRYQKRGHLFESRFRSVLVEKVNYLLALTRHIHLQAPSPDHPYSSFHLYVQDRQAGAGPRPAVLEMDEVLSFLQDKDNDRAYERYVLEGDKNEIQQLEKSLRRGAVLGSEAFQDQVKKKIEEHAQLQKESARRTNPVTLYFIGGMVIVATAA
jgi:putative transposase